MATTNYEAAISLIDEAHAQDPNFTVVDGRDIPYELQYARKMSHYLSLLYPDASPILKTAVRAQHFRRWEIPRSSYPLTKAGYLSWRTFLKKRQADLAAAICTACNFSADEASAVAALIRKDDLNNQKAEGADRAEAQALEDVACLVFLDDQLDNFEKSIEEDKMMGILRKTWKKMSPRAKELAAGIEMSERARELVQKAVAEGGGDGRG